MTNVDTATQPQVTGYANEVSYFATRYLQGDRVVYSLDLSPAQIAGLLPAPDPANPQPGNRRITPAHAAAFGNYVRNNKNWASPSILLRSRDEFNFDTETEVAGTEFGVIKLPFLQLSNIHILDGQHRILGIHMAIRGIAADLEKTKQALDRLEKKKPLADEDEEADRQDQIADFKARIDALNYQRYRFENERMSVQIIIEDEQAAFQQMFYDIADNALGITASVRARFDTRKAVNRVLQDVLLNDVLVDRVDLESDRLGRQNQHLLSAKHVADIIRIMAVGIEGRIGRRVEEGLNEDNLLEMTNKYFEALRDGFPQIKALVSGEEDALDLRARSMVASPVMLRVLAGVYKEMRKRGNSHLRIKRFFQDLDPYISKPATQAWVDRTGGELFSVGSLSPTSRRQDLVALTNLLVNWAENRPEWMVKEKQDREFEAAAPKRRGRKPKAAAPANTGDTEKSAA